MGNIIYYMGYKYFNGYNIIQLRYYKVVPSSIVVI